MLQSYREQSQQSTDSGSQVAANQSITKFGSTRLTIMQSQKALFSQMKLLGQMELYQIKMSPGRKGHEIVELLGSPAMEVEEASQ